MPQAPLTLDLIDEGRFAKRLEEKFAELQERMIAHVLEHGDEATGTAGELTVKITCKAGEDAVKFNLYDIKGTYKLSLPSEPAHVTKAMSSVRETGEPRLFVNALGGDKDSPRQEKFTTLDGRTDAAGR